MEEEPRKCNSEEKSIHFEEVCYKVVYLITVMNQR